VPRKELPATYADFEKFFAVSVENHLVATQTAHDYLRVIRSVGAPKQLPRVLRPVCVGGAFHAPSQPLGGRGGDPPPPPRPPPGLPNERTRLVSSGRCPLAPTPAAKNRPDRDLCELHLE
uniref:oxygenase MpaB family protein n=1 Tax=Nocardia cyriacigeorgica TaxID=135487 RepID=UPI003D76E023